MTFFNDLRRSLKTFERDFNHRFSGMNKRIDEADRRFQQIDEQFEKDTDERFKRINRGFERSTDSWSDEYRN
ncbi:hypothetical protein [Geomicrobium sp. JCM 19039]|uniref:hypothetical protein n=1 Tax=Geomicrobium sp. JCM 19039 TaxID=1460636 RepID=UPI00045F1CD0|nr:hypothetical protein [Geomicrobium sp. JCM 19039]GAK14162.1 hypothetical protein JCM19039_4059 [Geomicrobium sp. JCM 19039]